MPVLAPNKRYHEDTKPWDISPAPKPAGYLYSMPGQLLEMDALERQRLASFCKKAIDSWERSMSDHHENLRRWNDLLEGVIEDTSFPWVGCSNLHVPMVALHVVTLHSVMARSLLAVDPLWSVTTLDPLIRANAADVEDGINYKVKSDLNVVEVVRDALYCAPRDGITWIYLVWAEDTCPVDSVVRVASLDQFQSEFPTAESAGMSEEDYAAAAQAVQAEASEDSPYEVRVQYDRVDYRGPKARLVEECDMIRAPATAREIKDCRVYGHRYIEREQNVKDLAKGGKLWEDAVRSWAAVKSKNRLTDDRSRDSKNRIEGITEDADNFSDDRFLECLVVKFRPRGETREMKLLVTYSHDQNRVLGACKYPYIVDNYIPFRIIRRPNRMVGVSVVKRLEEMNESVDHSINYEINVSDLEMSPIFKGQRSAGEDFDPEAEENKIRPGVTWWMKEPDKFSVMEITGGDKNAAKSLRQELLRYGEMLIGPTQLLSGRESPGDPNAPGNKTIALIQQSNMRIEDYINEFRLGFDQLGNAIVALYYQFGAGIIEYVDKNGDVKGFSRDILRGLPKMSTHGVTANLSPEAEFVKAMAWFDKLLPIPEIGGNPTRRRELLNYLMVSGRLPNREALLPPKAEVEAEEKKQLMQEAKKSVILELIKAGVIPPPSPMMGMGPISGGIPGASGAGPGPVPPSAGPASGQSLPPFGAVVNG